jgi:hypothetical protein
VETTSQEATYLSYTDPAENHLDKEMTQRITAGRAFERALSQSDKMDGHIWRGSLPWSNENKHAQKNSRCVTFVGDSFVVAFFTCENQS